MIQIAFQNKIPVYIQIQDQIISLIKAGILKPGETLPSIRQMAKDNNVNANTVAKAYSFLEEKGYIVNLAQRGCYVSEDNVRESKKQIIKKLLTPYVDAGYTKEELIQMINELF